MGKAAQVPESMIDAVIGVSGSSPAYTYLFIEALADGAVAEGMPRQMAYEFRCSGSFRRCEDGAGDQRTSWCIERQCQFSWWDDHSAVKHWKKMAFVLR